MPARRLQIEDHRSRAFREVFAFLTGNIGDLPDLYRDVVPVWGFSGKPGDELVLAEHSGTARTVIGKRGASGAIEVPTITFAALTSETVALVKIDTDGYDASVIDSEIEFLRTHGPILWSEAEVRDATGVEQWRRTLDHLASIYSDVCVFDNFGFLVTWGSLAQKRQTIVELLGYCQRHAKGPPPTHRNPTIYHVDLAFFPPAQRALFEQFTRLVARSRPATAIGRSVFSTLVSMPPSRAGSLSQPFQSIAPA